jgi:hypothetical protein
MKIKDTYNPQSGFNRVAVISFLFVAIIAISSLLYFFVWRPADSDYQAAAAQVNSLKESNNALTSALAVVQDPGSITTPAVAKVENAANTYQQALSILKANVLISRDSTIKSTYDQTKSSLEKYKQSLNDLVKSLKLYTAAMDSCTQFTYSISGTDLNVKNDLLKKCLGDLKSGQSSKYKAFNDQYFDEYIYLTYSYVEAVVRQINATDKAASAAANTTIDQEYNAIQALGKKEIDYSISFPSDALNKLSSAIDSRQKSAF